MNISQLVLAGAFPALFGSLDVLLRYGQKDTNKL
jgi:hypothetical protein